MEALTAAPVVAAPTRYKATAHDRFLYYGGHYNLWFLITCLGDHSEVRLERWHLFEGLETELMGLTSALASLIALSDSKPIYALSLIHI